MAGRSYIKHTNVVSDMGNACSFTCCGGTGGVSVLADQCAAVSDQSISGLFFKCLICPGAGIFYFHGDIREFAAKAKQEGGITGDHFCVGVSADISDLDGAVFCIVLFLELSVGFHFRQLHSGYDARYITGLVNGGEIVVHVFQSGKGCLITGSMAELYIRILFSSFDHVIFVAEAVCKNDLTSLICKIHGLFSAGLILGNIEDLDNLVIFQSESFFHPFDTQHMSVSITFLLVADVDDTNFEIFLGNRLSCRSSKCRTGEDGSSHSEICKFFC